MTTTVTYDEISEDVKKLKKLLVKAEFFGARHGWESVAPGQKPTFHPNLISFWHENVLFHAHLDANQDIILRNEADTIGSIPMSRLDVTRELKQIVQRFLLYGVIVSEHGDKIAAAKGATDKTVLHEVDLWHIRCRGNVERIEIGTGHSALVCRNCYLRVVIPNTRTTFGQLRQFFKDLNP